MNNPAIIGKATIYNIDCMELLKATPDKFYDLAIVDPPYGIGESGKSNASRGSAAGANKFKGTRNTTGAGIASTKFIEKDWDSSAPDYEYFNELVRVSKNQIIWGANHFADRLPCPKSPCWIVWDKVNGETDFADSELAYTSFKTAVRNFKFQWNGMLQGDMKNKEQRIHPTQKPVKLYEWLLTKYAKQGDKILDTHCGSGSIAIACNNLGFELTACELDKDYYEASIKRIKQATAQERLFA